MKRWREPVLVSSTDGVGTKLKIAAAMGIHSTVGGDLVNHCVNDILTQGAEPLFFLDYLALGRMDPDVVEQLVEGMTRACHQADCALVGGETAELPDTYAPGEYDLAGFIVGVVERSRIMKTSAVRAGDVLLALPSLGLHTNGYSLARKLVFETAGLAADTYVAGDRQQNRRRTADAAPLLLAAAQKYRGPGLVTGMAHITGGGIPGNLPRVLPRGTQAVVELGSWPVLPIFSYLAKLGQIERDELLRTFNLGVGMILIVPPANLRAVETELKRRREKYYRIGEIRNADSRKAPIAFTGSLPI